MDQRPGLVWTEEPDTGTVGPMDQRPGLVWTEDRDSRPYGPKTGIGMDRRLGQ